MVSDQLFANPDPVYRRCSLNKHAEVGVRIIRQALLWKEIERKRDGYDWEYWDQYVADTSRHNIQLMPIIFDAPKWRQRKLPRKHRNKFGAVPPKDGAIARFAARLVRRYGPQGDFWFDTPRAGGAADPRLAGLERAEPAALLGAASQRRGVHTHARRATSEAIRFEDPGATVVTAGMPDSRLKRRHPALQVHHGDVRSGGARNVRRARRERIRGAAARHDPQPRQGARDHALLHRHGRRSGSPSSAGARAARATGSA